MDNRIIDAIAKKCQESAADLEENFGLLAAALDVFVEARINNYFYNLPSRRSYEREDLKQEAMVALLVALKQWDSSRGVAFLTYYFDKISAALRKECCKKMKDYTTERQFRERH